MSTPLGLALLITAALNLCCGYKRAAESPDRNVRVGGVPTKKEKSSRSRISVCTSTGHTAK